MNGQEGRCRPPPPPSREPAAHRGVFPVILQGGQTIEQIQKNSGARVQLSRAGEFYPGKYCLLLPASAGAHLARLTRVCGAVQARLSVYCCCLVLCTLC